MSRTTTRKTRQRRSSGSSLTYRTGKPSCSAFLRYPTESSARKDGGQDGAGNGSTGHSTHMPDLVSGLGPAANRTPLAPSPPLPTAATAGIPEHVWLPPPAYPRSLRPNSMNQAPQLQDEMRWQLPLLLHLMIEF